ncbi:hypothetical protein SDC9_161712 [bioreactor metagenome]|uniref:Uncharacterized protein n=1 Tax=bioreactor metagenome TaxID=1076179 RepID=A0A645FIY6_9ZZZZ
MDEAGAQQIVGIKRCQHHARKTVSGTLERQAPQHGNQPQRRRQADQPER